jgi:hypothetical protein
LSADDTCFVIDHGLDLIRIDTGQGDQNQDLPVGLQHIDRRFRSHVDCRLKNRWRSRWARADESIASDNIQLAGSFLRFALSRAR